MTLGEMLGAAIIEAEARERAKRFPVVHVTDARTGELLTTLRATDPLSLQGLARQFPGRSLTLTEAAQS